MVYIESSSMDRFVVRTPRGASNEAPTRAGKPRMKQATIESLQGVVVIEDILRMKAVLELENQTKEKMVEALLKVQGKMPSREVLMSTKIGRTINKLRKHKEAEVSKLANKIYKKWKTYLINKQDKPMIEVRSDLKTEKMRSSGRKMLADALSLQVEHKLVENIEREAFHQCKRLINFNYRRTMRSLIFTLKHQEEVRSKVLSSDTDVESLVKQCKK